MAWFEKNYAAKILQDKIKILDVGSYDVNGSYKNIFTDKKYEYRGLDMTAGSNVDIALKNPYVWSEIATDSFDLVISGQTLEHTEFFWITLSEMVRILKPNGLLCLIVPNGFGEHRYPVDCYRFFTDGLVALTRYFKLEPIHAHTNCAPRATDFDWYSADRADSLLIARKPYAGLPQLVDLKTYQCVPADQDKLRGDLIPYSARRKTLTYRFITTLENLIRKLKNG